MSPALVTPRLALLLARISSADWVLHDGVKVLDEHAVGAQIADLLGYADELGWGVGPPATHHITENDTSAYRVAMVPLLDAQGREVTDADGAVIKVRRPKRPEYWRALRMLRSGEADGVLFVDSDRGIGRHPRDLEDAIDVAELYGIPFRSMTSEDLNLNTHQGRAQARRKVAHDSESSADTARRVARTRRRHALSGLRIGGPRRFGWKPGNLELDSWEWPDREVPPKLGENGWDQGRPVEGTEAAEIRSWAEQVIAGVSLRQIAADLRIRDVPTPQRSGGRWVPSNIRWSLLHPAVMGRLSYKPAHPAGTPQTAQSRLFIPDQIKGVAPWPGIITEDEYWAIRSILLDPTRRSTPGNTPRHLLSGIARCERCEGPETVQRYMGHLVYHCQQRGCGSRIRVDLADAWVSARITARLKRPDAADLLPRPPTDTDTRVLEREQAALRARKTSQARLHALGHIDDDELAEGSAAIRERLDAIGRQLAAAREKSPLDGIAACPDAEQIWAKMPLGRKRAILREFTAITLGLADKSVPFDYSAVGVQIRE
jgi:site-specific DNA recombinase